MSKRTKQIDLRKMRKAFALKPLAVALSAFGLSGCSDNRQDAFVYGNAEDCSDQNPEFGQACQTTYQQALADAERVAPKYRTERDCEYEFGPNQCRELNESGGSFFMPFMAGYMVSNLFSAGRYATQPLFTSYSRRSPLYNHWFAGDGQDFGEIDIDIYTGKKSRYKRIRVPDKAFEPKPTVRKTISRGGFGSSVRAKSSWGSSRKSGWGG